MKKIILVMMFGLLCTAMAQATKGDFSVAGQFSYGSYKSHWGLGMQLQYEPATNFRIAPEFNYYFKTGDRYHSDRYSMINVSLNLHYLIPLSHMFTVYPLAGFAYNHYEWEYSNNEDKCGANVGCGVEYRLNRNITFFKEERFQIVSDYNQYVSFLGFKYTF